VARLFYVIGASGAGKDTLLRYARERSGGSGRVVFAHRYITRPAAAGGENHVALSPAEFAVRRARGCFALHWRAHDLEYAIGREILGWLEQGLDVVVNGSRAALAEARAAFPGLVAIVVDAPPALVRERLARRGRESASAIDARLARAALSPTDEGPIVRILNDGPLERAGERLVEVISRSATGG
jgi:ribose 1,5-bisphosphokinase